MTVALGAGGLVVNNGALSAIKDVNLGDTGTTTTIASTTTTCTGTNGLQVTGAGGFHVSGGDVAMDHSVTVGASMSVTGSVLCNAVGADSVTCTSGSKVPRRIVIESVNAGRTIGFGGTDLYVLPDSVWSTSRTVTLSRTGAVNGISEMEVLNYDTVNTIHVSDNGLGTIIDLPPTVPGVPTRGRFLFFGGIWVLS